MRTQVSTRGRRQNQRFKGHFPGSADVPRLHLVSYLYAWHLIRDALLSNWQMVAIQQILRFRGRAIKILGRDWNLSPGYQDQMLQIGERCPEYQRLNPKKVGASRI